jgi:hypothetical protein
LTSTRDARSEGAGPLVDFYRGRNRAGCGATIDEILGWDDGRLERVHDYIQWLFPLRSRSGAVPTAPVLDARQIDAFRADQELRSRLEAAFKRMLAFYGLACVSTESGLRVERSSSFEDRARAWLRPRNHNYLRLTRIMTSLRLLGLPEHATALFRALDRIYVDRPEAIGPATFAYWKSASRS